MFKIEGLDELQKQLDDLQKVLEQIDGDLGSVSFEADDPESISKAILDMETLVDSKVVGFESNETINDVVEEVKQNLRQSILEKAAAARLEGE